MKKRDYNKLHKKMMSEIVNVNKWWNDKYIVPERWACLPRWNSERDGIFWPPKGDNYGIY